MCSQFDLVGHFRWEWGRQVINHGPCLEEAARLDRTIEDVSEQVTGGIQMEQMSRSAV